MHLPWSPSSSSKIPAFFATSVMGSISASWEISIWDGTGDLIFTGISKPPCSMWLQFQRARVQPFIWEWERTPAHSLARDCRRCGYRSCWDWQRNWCSKLADAGSVLALFKTERNIEHRRRRMVANCKRLSLVTRFGLLGLFPGTPNRTARVLLGARRAHFKIHLFPTWFIHIVERCRSSCLYSVMVL